MSLYLREFRLIFEGTREGVVAIAARSIRDANPAFCELLGYSHSQLLRQDPLDLLTPGSKAALDRARAGADVGAPPMQTLDMTLISRRGTQVPVSVRILKADTCWFLFVQPRATEQSGTQERTSSAGTADESRERYRSLVENLADGLITLNDIGELLFVNRAFAGMLGYAARSRLVARPLVDLVSDEDRERVVRGMRRWEAGEPARFEANLMHAGGALVPVLLSGRSLPPSTEGVPSGMLVMVTDFAERRALLDKLALSRQMEALSSLAGGIAHDFNNLLTGILGNASAIRSLAKPNSEIADLSLGVEESAELAARLTQRLLALVRGQAPHRTYLDVGALVEATLHLLHRVIPPSIQVMTQVDPDLPPVLADESQLQQAILNLCINARDAMQAYAGGGVLNLKVSAGLLSKPLDDGDVAEEPAVMLQVTDSGPGVPVALRRRIFDPFFTTKGLGRGMGLGLSSVYNLVHAHGGNVEVDAGPTGGARFSLRLPAQPGRRPAHRTRPTPMEPLPMIMGAGTVLVAEDEPGILAMVSTMLRKQGYEVLTAEDGLQALEVWRVNKDRIDLLMLDVRMPHVDGMEVLRKARIDRPGVPAVLSSGFIPESHESDPDLPESIFFLPKPYRMPELLLAVSRALAGPPSGDFAQITPTGDLQPVSDHGTERNRSVPAGKGFDPARTLSEGEMPVFLGELSVLLTDDAP